MVKIASTSASGNGWVSESSCEPVKVGRRTGNHQQPAVVAVRAHLVEEHHLVGEDVGRVAVVVVEVAQLADRGSTAARPTGPPMSRRPARCTGGNGPSGAAASGCRTPPWPARACRRPSGTRSRRSTAACARRRAPKSACSDVEVDRPRVVHVERHRLSVVDHQPGVADRAVGGRAQRDDHHVEVALGPADAVLDRVGGLEEAVKAELLELAAQVGHREVRQQHDGVLVDVLAQVLRVEVVAVQVRDVQVVAVAERVPVQRAVVREREPRREVRRVHPRVAQDASGAGCRSGSRRARRS